MSPDHERLARITARLLLRLIRGSSITQSHINNLSESVSNLTASLNRDAAKHIARSVEERLRTDAPVPPPRDIDLTMSLIHLSAAYENLRKDIAALTELVKRKPMTHLIPVRAKVEAAFPGSTVNVGDLDPPGHIREMRGGPGEVFRRNERIRRAAARDGIILPPEYVPIDPTSPPTPSKKRVASPKAKRKVAKPVARPKTRK